MHIKSGIFIGLESEKSKRRSKFAPERGLFEAKTTENINNLKLQKLKKLEYFAKKGAVMTTRNRTVFKK